jgi:cytochrome P450 family 4
LESYDFIKFLIIKIFQGHDTTTSGIAFCLYNLAKFPETQKKAFDEIRNVIGDDVNRPVSQNDLNNLNYLDLCIKESLRIYPSVPIYGRKIHENVEISEKLCLNVALRNILKF